jgi:hypothetical protein
MLMYAVKVEYHTTTAISTKTRVFTFTSLKQAIGTFHSALRACESAEPIQAKSGKAVEILSVWLYQMDANSAESAIEAVESGRAVLMDQLTDHEFKPDAESN